MKHGKIERALISVSDKRGLESFARLLSQMGVEILATGGTKELLHKAGIPVREVAEVTGFPEMMDGRVKTLHPRIHGGILALRDERSHQAALEEHAIPPIDLVVVNLYPFEQTVAREGCERAEAIEKIDIGGPSMVRSAAKNHRHVAVVVDPADYGRVLDEMQRSGGVSDEMRRELARKAFALTARYDAAISAWLRDADGDAQFPASFALAGTKARELRYGENDHQKAALYLTGEKGPSAAAAEVVAEGKELSYNNLVDLDAALAIALEFDEPFACVVKHNNPCGAACGKTIAEALELAWAGDPLSAFGSVLALNRPLDRAAADFLTSEKRFVEAILAPSFDAETRERLMGAKGFKSLRLLASGPLARSGKDAREVKHLRGGFLVQDRDLAAETERELKVVTRAQPTAEQVRALLFAARVAKHVKSNAIVLARGGAVVGVGAGQMSRVDSVHLACRKAGERARGAVLASDAFFPFPDGAIAAIDSGVAALLEPGGSVRDPEVIAACDERGVPLVFTGRRHFRH